MTSQTIKSHLTGKIISSNDANANSLYEKSVFGEKKEGKIQYSLAEALYLVEKNKLEVLDSKNKPINEDELQKKFKKFDKKFQLKYEVFKDLRDKGYIVKTALKFGAEFRVYDKGKKPHRHQSSDKSASQKDHAKWIVFTDHESNKISWHEFSAKNRVAHSTKKNLLLAILDEEGAITYYEVDWVKT